MASVAEELTKTSAIKIDESKLRGHVDEVVRSSVEEMLSSLLEAEADHLAGAKKYERPVGRPRPKPKLKAKCEFYLAWCNWGNNRPPDDPGKGWKRNARCLECHDDCVKNGMWSFGKCPMGHHGPRWRGPDSSWPKVGEY